MRGLGRAFISLAVMTFCAVAAAQDRATCSLSEATYVGEEGVVTFGGGDTPAMQFSSRDGNQWQGVHTGGHGRGANYYDRAADLYYEYWFDGLRGEVAIVANAEAAPTTLTLERLGDFVRTCP